MGHSLCVCKSIFPYTRSEIEIIGPYLDSRIKVVIDGKIFPLRKDKVHPFVWKVQLAGLSPGDYAIGLIGDPELGESGTLSNQLHVHTRSH